MEESAVVAGTAKLEAAKTLIDWTLTRKANEMYNVGYAVPAMPTAFQFWVSLAYAPSSMDQFPSRLTVNL